MLYTKLVTKKRKLISLLLIPKIQYSEDKGIEGKTGCLLAFRANRKTNCLSGQIRRKFGFRSYKLQSTMQKWINVTFVNKTGIQQMPELCFVDFYCNILKKESGLYQTTEGHCLLNETSGHL